MNRGSGFTLVEVLIAIGILAVMGYLSSMLIVSISNKSVDSLDLLGKSSDTSVIFTWLQRNFHKKELVIRGFTGSGPTSGLGRFIVPFPDKCSDLKSHCAGDTSLLLASLDLRKSQMVTGICAIGATKLILDLGYKYLGDPNLDSDGVQVNSMNKLMGGKINIVKDAILAIVDDPSATIFIATNTPKVFDPKYDPVSGTFGDPNFAANPNCIALVKDPASLVEIDIKPYILPNTGTTSPSNSLIIAAMGEFPVALTQVKILSVGRSPSHSTQFGVRQCNEQYPNDCNNEEFLFVDQVGSSKIFEYFKIGLGSNGFTTRYDIGHSSSCADGNCRSLTYPNVIPYFAPGETSNVIQDKQFSYIKQDVLDKIEFEIEDLSGGKKVKRRYYLEGL